MATNSKGKILKEQITFDFFETMEQVQIKPKKEKVTEKPKVKEKVQAPKQTIFKKLCNVKPNHKKLNRKIKRI